MVSSNIYLFNITKDKPFTNDNISDEIFGALQFEGNYMYALGAAKTYVYNSYGKCIENIDYEDRELIGYDIDDSMVALLFNDSSKYSNGSKVCSYTQRGSLQGEFIMESKARFVDCKNNNIAVDNNRVVSILDSRCREKFQLNIGTALSDFQYAGNATHAIGITATGADIIEVRNRG